MSDCEAALAALREWSSRAAANPVRILEVEAVRAAEALQAMVSDSDPVVDLDTALALGWYHWLRHVALRGEGGRDDLAAAQWLGRVYRVVPGAVPESVRDFFDSILVNNLYPSADSCRIIRCGSDLLSAYRRTMQPELLDQAVALFRAALAATPEDHPDRSAHLNQFADALYMLFERRREPAVLREAVGAVRQAIAATPDGHPDSTVLQQNLVIALRVEFEHTGRLEVLVEAVNAMRQSVMATPDDHPDRGGRLNNLGIGLRELFERTGNMADLEDAVRTGCEAVAATPEGHPSRAGRLSNLGILLRTVFEHAGRVEALDEAVRVGRSAVAAAPQGHPNRALCLDSLAATLRTLFEHGGLVEVLEEAVDVGRDAVAATPEGHPDRASSLSNLAIALRCLFECLGKPETLAEAVETVREAVSIVPDKHPDRARILNNLGTVLQPLFKITGDLAVLTEAVQAARQAVAATPEHDVERAAYLSSYGGTLLLQFECTGELAVLTEAVETVQQVVLVTPNGHPHFARRLCNSGIVLLKLFGRTKELALLSEATETIRRSVLATSDDHPDFARHLAHLGIALLASFERTGEAEVLTEAIQAMRLAVSATSDKHSDRPGRLHNLGIALLALFEHIGELEVLTEAIQVNRDALSVTPEEHSERARYLHGLGAKLRALFDRTKEPSVIVEAGECYRLAASSAMGATLVRISAYRQVAQLSLEAGDLEDGLPYVEAAVELIDTLAPGSLARADREHQLSQLAEFPAEAAVAALSAGRPERAVELLERTRGVLAAEVLGMRGGELSRLRQGGQWILADRLEALRTRLGYLDRIGVGEFADEAAHTAQQSALGDRLIAQQRREAHAEWADLLEEIRALPGFAYFFRTPPVQVLARHAGAGPVVYVTVGPTRADALILTDAADPVRVVPLPGLTRSAAYEQSNRILRAYRTKDARDLKPLARHGERRDFVDVLAWLWDVLVEPILAALGHTAKPANGAHWPRVWWCPVGVLAFLPVHAAGHYDPSLAPGEAPCSALDLVISSYTATVRALAQEETARSNFGRATMVVPVPDLLGAELPGVDAETSVISSLIPDVRVLRQPTRADVLKALPVHWIAHFSCHGHVNWEQPGASCLLLADHKTSPLTVADVAGVRLDAELAFLSACSTTVTTPRLVDEFLHITGAFQLAGYRQVIGTLWPIIDSLAPEIAGEFYRHLTDGGTAAVQPERSAEALHRAIQRLRQRFPGDPSVWAAHIHVGS